MLTRPDVIAEIHAQYLEAGADIIETNTFSGTAIAQADYGLEPLVYELNLEARAARAARRPTSGRRGRPTGRASSPASIGPTNRTLSISPDVNNPAFRAITFDEMRDAYKEQVARPDRRRLRPAAARDDLRHAERQGGARRDRGGVRGDGRARCR